MKKPGKEKQHSSSAGFTLVELVVVLVLLAILAAILVPACLGYIDRSKRSKEQSHAKALLNATQAKLTALYDQGIMPNRHHKADEWNMGDGAYSWYRGWGDEALFQSGLEENPYICGFFAGNLVRGKGRINYLESGLSGLKKGYRIYVFVYMETSSSAPIFYYEEPGSDELWHDEPPAFGKEGNTRTLETKSEGKVYLAELCVLNGCGGNGSASNGKQQIREAEAANFTWPEVCYSLGLEPN